MTQSELKSLLNYDQDTGIFTWIKQVSNKKIGLIAGTEHPKGYVIIRINKHNYRAHRLAWLYINGEWPKNILDHINGVRSDNRISNLREVTNSQNNYNSKMSSKNTSGVKGVSWHKRDKKWRVQIRINCKNYHLGSFDDFELAQLIAYEARIKFHGEYANHGK